MIRDLSDLLDDDDESPTVIRPSYAVALTVARLERALSRADRKIEILLSELRSYHESRGLPGLGWDCRQCGAFNGDGKERLQACRCCDAPRP